MPSVVERFEEQRKRSNGTQVAVRQTDIPSGLQPNALLAPQQVEDQPADQPRQGGQGALPSQWPDSVSPTPTRGGSSLRRR